MNDMVQLIPTELCILVTDSRVFKILLVIQEPLCYIAFWYRKGAILS